MIADVLVGLVVGLVIAGTGFLSNMPIEGGGVRGSVAMGAVFGAVAVVARHRRAARASRRTSFEPTPPSDDWTAPPYIGG